MPGLSCRVGTGIPCQARTLYSSPHPHTPSQVEVPPLPAWTPPLPSLKSLPPGLRLSLRVLPGCDSSTSPSRRWLPALRTWVMSGRLCHPSPPATVAIRTLWRRRHKHPESKATSATLGDGCQPPPSHLLGSGSTSSAYFLFLPTSFLCSFLIALLRPKCPFLPLTPLKISPGHYQKNRVGWFGFAWLRETL